MGQHPESTHKNQHYASFPGFLAKKQEFQSLQCRGRLSVRLTPRSFEAHAEVVRPSSRRGRSTELTPRSTNQRFVVRVLGQAGTLRNIQPQGGAEPGAADEN